MRILAATEGLRAPIHVICPEEAYISPATIERLRLLGRTPSARHHVIALPDVSWKDRNDTPTGTVLATAGTLVPQALDGEPNCGMRLMVTDVPADDLDTRTMDTIAARLAERLPVCHYGRKVISHEVLEDILRRGAAGVVDHYGMDPSELERIEDRGRHLAEGEITRKDVRRAVPSWLIRDFTRSRLGSLGSGNHFVELRRVDRILDPAKAEALGLRAGRLAVMFHSGSTGLGVYVSHFYGPRPNVDTHVTVFCHWSRWISGRVGMELRFAAYRLRNPRRNPTVLYEYDADSPAARRYRMALAMASNFAYANRTYLGQQVRQALREVLAEPNLRLDLVCCLSHVSLRRETHFGETLWIHRHGASRAMPAPRLPQGHPFKATGELALVPGSLGSDAYVCAADAENAHTFCSVNHGSGVREGLPEGRPNDTVQQFAERMLKEYHVRVYKGDHLNVVKADPRNYRDVGASVRSLVENRLAQPICSLAPLMAYKE